MKKLYTLALFASIAFGAMAQTSAEADSIARLSREIEELKQDYAQLKEESDQRSADADLKKIWKRNSFVRIGYSATSSSFRGFEQGNKGGVSLQMGHTYLYPNQPIANLLKVGFDAIWLDFNYGQLKNNGYHYDDIDLGYDEDWDVGDLDDYLSLKPSYLTVGMGIGPNVTLTPLYMLDNAARELKVSLYGHYRPSLGAYMVSEDGEQEVSFGYVGMWAFGGCIKWRMIGVGVEGNWGSGNFNSLVDEFADEYYEGDRSGKRKFSSCRVYFSFNF